MKRLVWVVAVLAGVVLVTAVLWGPSPDSRRGPKPDGAAGTTRARESRSGSFAGTGPSAGPGTGVEPSPKMGTFTGTEAGTGTFTVPNAGAGGTEEREAERRLPPEVREAVRRDTRGLVEIVGPNGEVGVDLQGRFQHVPVATANEDGSVTVEEH